MEPGNNLFNALLEKLQGLLRTETVLGEPLALGAVTLLPVLTVSFFLGGGEGGQKEEGVLAAGNYGAGLGCKITPAAILIFKEGELTVVPLTATAKSPLEKIVEMAEGFLDSKTTPVPSGTTTPGEEEYARL